LAKKLRMVNLFNYLLIFNIFAGGFVLFSSPFEFYLGYIFIILFLVVYIVHCKKFKINRIFFAVLAILTVSSLVNVYLGNTTVFSIAKQAFGILITATAYYLLIGINNYEIDKLFRIYLKIALLVAAIGIFQELSFLVKFKQGYDFSYVIPKWGLVIADLGIPRLNSICLEPAHFAISMAPAFFVSLLNIFRKYSPYSGNKLCSLIIIISLILTFSAIAYIAIFISLLLIFNIKKIKFLFLWVVIMPILFYAAYSNVPEIKLRVRDSVNVVTGSQKVANSNVSVYAIATNAFVAYKSFIDNPLFGAGLGSHPISYDKYLCSGGSIGFWNVYFPSVNAKDAGSLFLRLVSETGLFGILVVFYFIFKFRLKSINYKNSEIISNAIFILFILQLIRQGHYFYNGFFFFVWMYYFSYKINNNTVGEIKIQHA